MKIFWNGLISLLLVSGLMASELPLSYDISVSLDPEAHRLVGTEDIQWRNTTATPTSEIYFHLYLNAFANSHSTFNKELGGGTLRGKKQLERHWGWTEIRQITTRDEVDLLPTLEFVHPDDLNEEDRTVARVTLPKAVEPGAAIQLHLEFEAQLPRVIARTGWADAFHLVGQWFPKLGVFEAAGHGGRAKAGWNCHQFHASSEFYADFASFRVEISVPEDYVVGAVGVEVEHRLLAEGNSRRLIQVYTAENVHDFAWCAAPESMMSVVEAEFDPGRDIPRSWLEKAEEQFALSAAELELPTVHLRLLIPQQQKGLAGRTLHAARLALAWYGLHYGPYPYPQLTIISPPPTATEAGGMEYPTFITTGAAKLMEYFPFSMASMIEMVTIHEFGHQYFYGMLASNEFEQAWMDEGLNSYAETSCRAAIAEEKLVPGILNFSPWASARLEFSGQKGPLLVDQYAWEYRTRSDYGMASYTKTKLWLKTLEGLVGGDTFAAAMRNYSLQWRFKHPTGEDLMQSLSESTGQDLDWFFAQALEGDTKVDFALRSVRIRPTKPLEGARWTEKGWVEEKADKEKSDKKEANEKGPWTIKFDVLRKGDFSGPVEILLIFADGEQEKRSWDGLARWKHFEFESDKRIDGIVVDPDGIWALETQRRNNYWRHHPSTPPRSWIWSLGRLISFIPTIWS